MENTKKKVQNLLYLSFITKQFAEQLRVALTATQIVFRKNQMKIIRKPKTHQQQQPPMGTMRISATIY